MENKVPALRLRGGAGEFGELESETGSESSEEEAAVSLIELIDDTLERLNTYAIVDERGVIAGTRPEKAQSVTYYNYDGTEKQKVEGEELENIKEIDLKIIVAQKINYDSFPQNNIIYKVEEYPNGAKVLYRHNLSGQWFIAEPIIEIDGKVINLHGVNVQKNGVANAYIGESVNEIVVGLHETAVKRRRNVEQAKIDAIQKIRIVKARNDSKRKKVILTGEKLISYGFNEADGKFSAEGTEVEYKDGIQVGDYGRMKPSIKGNTLYFTPMLGDSDYEMVEINSDGRPVTAVRRGRAVTPFIKSYTGTDWAEDVPKAKITIQSITDDNRYINKDTQAEITIIKPTAIRGRLELYSIKGEQYVDEYELDGITLRTRIRTKELDLTSGIVSAYSSQFQNDFFIQIIVGKRIISKLPGIGERIKSEKIDSNLRALAEQLIAFKVFSVDGVAPDVMRRILSDPDHTRVKDGIIERTISAQRTGILGRLLDKVSPKTATYVFDLKKLEFVEKHALKRGEELEYVELGSGSSGAEEEMESVSSDSDYETESDDGEGSSGEIIGSEEQLVTDDSEEEIRAASQEGTEEGSGIEDGGEVPIVEMTTGQVNVGRKTRTHWGRLIGNMLLSALYYFFVAVPRSFVWPHKQYRSSNYLFKYWIPYFSAILLSLIMAVVFAVTGITLAVTVSPYSLFMLAAILIIPVTAAFFPMWSGRRLAGDVLRKRTRPYIKEILQREKEDNEERLNNNKKFKFTRLKVLRVMAMSRRFTTGFFKGLFVDHKTSKSKVITIFRMIAYGALFISFIAAVIVASVSPYPFASVMVFGIGLSIAGFMGIIAFRNAWKWAMDTNDNWKKVESDMKKDILDVVEPSQEEKTKALNRLDKIRAGAAVQAEEEADADQELMDAETLLRQQEPARRGFRNTLRADILKSIQNREVLGIGDNNKGIVHLLALKWVIEHEIIQPQTEKNQRPGRIAGGAAEVLSSASATSSRTSSESSLETTSETSSEESSEVSSEVRPESVVIEMPAEQEAGLFEGTVVAIVDNKVVITPRGAVTDADLQKARRELFSIELREHIRDQLTGEGAHSVTLNVANEINIDAFLRAVKDYYPKVTRLMNADDITKNDDRTIRIPMRFGQRREDVELAPEEIVQVGQPVSEGPLQGLVVGREIMAAGGSQELVEEDVEREEGPRVIPGEAGIQVKTIVNNIGTNAEFVEQARKDIESELYVSNDKLVEILTDVYNDRVVRLRDMSFNYAKKVEQVLNNKFKELGLTGLMVQTIQYGAAGSRGMVVVYNSLDPGENTPAERMKSKVARSQRAFAAGKVFSLKGIWDVAKHWRSNYRIWFTENATGEAVDDFVNRWRFRRFWKTDSLPKKIGIGLGGLAWGVILFVPFIIYRMIKSLGLPVEMIGEWAVKIGEAVGILERSHGVKDIRLDAAAPLPLWQRTINAFVVLPVLRGMITRGIRGAFRLKPETTLSEAQIVDRRIEGMYENLNFDPGFVIDINVLNPAYRDEILRSDYNSELLKQILGEDRINELKLLNTVADPETEEAVIREEQLNSTLRNEALRKEVFRIYYKSLIATIIQNDALQYSIDMRKGLFNASIPILLGFRGGLKQHWFRAFLNDQNVNLTYGRFIISKSEKETHGNLLVRTLLGLEKEGSNLVTMSLAFVKVMLALLMKLSYYLSGTFIGIFGIKIFHKFIFNPVKIFVTELLVHSSLARQFISLIGGSIFLITEFLALVVTFKWVLFIFSEHRKTYVRKFKQGLKLYKAVSNEDYPDKAQRQKKERAQARDIIKNAFRLYSKIAFAIFLVIFIFSLVNVIAPGALSQFTFIGYIMQGLGYVSVTTWVSTVISLWAPTNVVSPDLLDLTPQPDDPNQETQWGEFYTGLYDNAADGNIAGVTQTLAYSSVMDWIGLSPGDLMGLFMNSFGILPGPDEDIIEITGDFDGDGKEDTIYAYDRNGDGEPDLIDPDGDPNDYNNWYAQKIEWGNGNMDVYFYNKDDNKQIEYIVKYDSHNADDSTDSIDDDFLVSIEFKSGEHEGETWTYEQSAQENIIIVRDADGNIIDEYLYGGSAFDQETFMFDNQDIEAHLEFDPATGELESMTTYTYNGPDPENPIVTSEFVRNDDGSAEWIFYDVDGNVTRRIEFEDGFSWQADGTVSGEGVVYDADGNEVGTASMDSSDLIENSTSRLIIREDGQEDFILEYYNEFGENVGSSEAAPTVTIGDTTYRDADLDGVPDEDPYGNKIIIRKDYADGTYEIYDYGDTLYDDDPEVEYVRQYNEDGALIRIDDYDDTGTYIEEQIYYDGKGTAGGNILVHNRFNSNGTLTDQNIFADVDNDGDLDLYMEYHINGGVKYDNNPITIIHSDPGDPSNDMTIEWDPDTGAGTVYNTTGQITGNASKDADGNIIITLPGDDRVITISQNDNGTLDEILTEDLAGNDLTHEYYANGRLLLKQEYIYDADMNLLVMNEYDSNGDLIEQHVNWDVDGEYIEVIYYMTYDDDGDGVIDRAVTIIKYKDGSTETISWDVDESGNVTGSGVIEDAATVEWTDTGGPAGADTGIIITYNDGSKLEIWQDEDGNLVQLDRYSADGDLTTEFYEDGKLTGTWEYDYESGRLITITKYDADGDITVVETYQFDGNQDVLIQEDFYDADGEKIISQNYYNLDGSLRESWNYTYDGGGNLETIEKFDDTGTRFQKEYYDNGELVMRNNYDTDGVSIVTRETFIDLDNDGQLDTLIYTTATNETQVQYYDGTIEYINWTTGEILDEDRNVIGGVVVNGDASLYNQDYDPDAPAGSTETILFYNDGTVRRIISDSEGIPVITVEEDITEHFTIAIQSGPPTARATTYYIDLDRDGNPDKDKFGNDMIYKREVYNTTGAEPVLINITVYHYDNIAGANPAKISEDIYTSQSDFDNGIIEQTKFYSVDTGAFTGYWEYDYDNNRINIYNDTYKLIGWDTYASNDFDNLIASRRYEYDVGNNMILIYEKYFYDIDGDGKLDTVTYVTNNNTDIDGDGEIDTTVTFIEYGDGSKETIVWDTDNDGIIYNEAGEPVGSAVLHGDETIDPETGLPVKTYLTMVYNDYTEIDITQDMYGIVEARDITTLETVTRTVGPNTYIVRDLDGDGNPDKINPLGPDDPSNWVIIKQTHISGRVTIYNYDNLVADEPVLAREDIYNSEADYTNGDLAEQIYYEAGALKETWTYNRVSGEYYIEIEDSTGNLTETRSYYDEDFQNVKSIRQYEYDAFNERFLVSEDIYDTDGDLLMSFDRDGQGTTGITTFYEADGQTVKETIEWSNIDKDSTTGAGIAYNSAHDAIGIATLEADTTYSTPGTKLTIDYSDVGRADLVIYQNEQGDIMYQEGGEVGMGAGAGVTLKGIQEGAITTKETTGEQQETTEREEKKIQLKPEVERKREEKKKRQELLFERIVNGVGALFGAEEEERAERDALGLKYIRLAEFQGGNPAVQATSGGLQNIAEAIANFGLEDTNSRLTEIMSVNGVGLQVTDAVSESMQDTTDAPNVSLINEGAMVSINLTMLRALDAIRNISETIFESFTAQLLAGVNPFTADAELAGAFNKMLHYSRSETRFDIATLHSNAVAVARWASIQDTTKQYTDRDIKQAFGITENALPAEHIILLNTLTHSVYEELAQRGILDKGKWIGEGIRVKFVRDSQFDYTDERAVTQLKQINRASVLAETMNSQAEVVYGELALIALLENKSKELNEQNISGIGNPLSIDTAGNIVTSAGVLDYWIREEIMRMTGKMRFQDVKERDIIDVTNSAFTLMVKANPYLSAEMRNNLIKPLPADSAARKREIERRTVMLKEYIEGMEDAQARSNLKDVLQTAGITDTADPKLFVVVLSAVSFVYNNEEGRQGIMYCQAISSEHADKMKDISQMPFGLKIELPKETEEAVMHLQGDEASYGTRQVTSEGIEVWLTQKRHEITITPQIPQEPENVQIKEGPVRERVELSRPEEIQNAVLSTMLNIAAQLEGAIAKGVGEILGAASLTSVIPGARIDKLKYEALDSKRADMYKRIESAA
ncbi:MAG: hypothetical protein ABH857_01430 [Elusimicrobiota bacterium]